LTKRNRSAHALSGTLLIALAIALASAAACGEEAGVGHYIPGATSSFIDMLPDRGSSSAVVANAFTYYDGSASSAQELEFGGLLTAGGQGTIYSDTFLFQCQGPWKMAGTVRRLCSNRQFQER